MSEIKAIITEQLQQLQMLMHRATFQGNLCGGRMHNPHRGQGRVLAILKLKPEISQKELTYLLNMSKQALAELLAKLEKSGYITREPSEEDRRVQTIKLTEAGMNAAGEVDDGAPEAAKILDCLNEEELAAFSDYLDRIIRRYEELFPGEDFDQRRKMMEAFMFRHGPGFGGFPGRPGGFGEGPEGRSIDFFGGFGGGHGRCGKHGSHDRHDDCCGHDGHGEHCGHGGREGHGERCGHGGQGDVGGHGCCGHGEHGHHGERGESCD